MIRSSNSLTRFVLGAFCLVVPAPLVACGGPEPKSAQALADDGVPANSASEARIESGESKDKEKPKAKTSGTEPGDPTQPYMTALPTEDGSDAPAAAAGGKRGGPGPGSPPGNPKAGATGKKTGKVSKAECSELFDRYIDLTLRTDERFEGIPPEMIQQLKSQGLAQAAQQKGDPCAKEDVSRAQYDCAMAATHPKQWEKCMK